MCQLDERVLELLAEDGWASPRIMVRRFRFTASPRRVAARCERLREAGFVEPLVEGGRQYELTVWGKRYLDGELDAANHGPAARNCHRRPTDRRDSQRRFGP